MLFVAVAALALVYGAGVLAAWDKRWVAAGVCWSLALGGLAAAGAFAPVVAAGIPVVCAVRCIPVAATGRPATIEEK